MRIAIDIQGLQTASRERGVGRYTFDLIHKLLEVDTENEYLLVGNADLPPANVEAFPPDRFRLIMLSYPKQNRDASETILETALLAADVDIYHITGPFEHDDAIVPRCSRSFPFKVVSAFYDLIPYLFSRRYLADPTVSEWYHRRLRNTVVCDHLLAISECTRQDAMKHLSVNPDKVTSVGTGVSPSFEPLPPDLRPNWIHHLQHRFGIDTRFVFYLGGDDLRKNISGLVSAYSRLQGSVRDECQLVLGGKLRPSEVRRYLDIARKLGVDQRLVFTHDLTDNELTALYSLCDVFVFPSEYEGFGLPLAEAMACGAPVIANNASSLPEVAGDAGILVEPKSVEQLTEAIGRVLLDGELRAEMSRRSVEQARRFSWEDVARRVLEVYQQLGPRDTSSFDFKRIPGPPGEKPKIALFSPLNPVKSGISDYTEDLLPYLVEHFQIDLYLDSGYSPTGEFVLKHCRWYDHQDFEQRMEEESYLAILCQLGNSPYHAYMVNYILKYGGIITLHDYGLGGLVDWLSRQLPHTSPNRLDLSRELVYGYGKADANAILERMQQGKLWTNELATENIFLNRRFFERSIGMIVHNQWAYDMATKDFPDYPHDCLKRIPQGVPALAKPAPEEISTIRQRLGIAEDALVVGTFGLLGVYKRVTTIVKAFARLARENNKAILLLVGECPSTYLEPLQLVQRHALAEKVLITGHVDFESFHDYMKACDIVLSLRYPTHGETSASLLRALSLGKPAIISNAGSFTELPEDVVSKAAYGPDDEDDVTEKLMLLAQDAELRHRMGENAHSYISNHHSMTAASREYVEFILKCPQERSAQIKLVADFAGKMLARSGVSSSDDHALDLVSRAIARVL